VVAPLKLVDQKIWLGKAARFKWSVSKLRDAIHQALASPWDGKDGHHWYVDRLLQQAERALELANASILTEAEVEYLSPDDIDRVVGAFGETAGAWVAAAKTARDLAEACKADPNPFRRRRRPDLRTLRPKVHHEPKPEGTDPAARATYLNALREADLKNGNQNAFGE
jgi:hypothetical protein